MRPTDFRMPGAVDLSGLKARATAPPAPPRSATGAAGGPADTAGAAGGHVIDVTEADFQTAVLEQSMQVPVLLDFWAEWCGPCKQLSPVLERLANAADGAWVLAKIDVDANQRLAAAFQVQSIPSVFAVIAGQPVPLFQGALPEQQIQPVLDEVLRVAATNGVTGRHVAGAAAATDGAAGAAEPAVPELDPAYDVAQDALERGDLEAAAAAYRDLLARDPADDVAKAALVRIELLARTEGADEPAVRQHAIDAPDDVEAQAAVADLDMVLGRVDEAIGRLVETVRRTSGADRDLARQRLLQLFEVLDDTDPRLAAGRRALANALY